MSIELLSSRISGFFKTFDTFSDSHSFKVKSHKGYSSSWGGIVSLVFFCYAIFYIIQISNLFISGNFLDIDITHENKLNQIISTNNFPEFHVGFCLRNSEYQLENFLTKNLNFSLNFETKKFQKNEIKKTQNEIPLENCILPNDTLSSLYGEELSNLNFTDCKCIDFSRKEFVKRNFSMKNLEENLEKNFFSMSVGINNNLPQKNISEILDYVKNNNPQLSLFFPDARVNNENEELHITPIELHLKMKDYYLDFSSTKILNLNFGRFIYDDFKKFYTNDDSKEFNKIKKRKN